MVEPISLLIDDQIFTRLRYGGIARYFYELWAGFGSGGYQGIDLIETRPWAVNEYLIEQDLARKAPSMWGKTHRLLGWVNRLTLGKVHPAVLHHTYYYRPYLDWLQPEIRVVTVHDMIPETHPHYYPGGNPHTNKEEFVRSADLVICVSTTTRDSMLNIYGEIDKPIAVIPLGVGDLFKPGRPRPVSLPESYFLYVGDRGRYKDFEILVRALGIAHALSDIHLVAVGGGSFSRVERALFRESGIENRVTHVAISSTELAGAYANALALVSTSRLEGFGLPTLEAMASGCPVILADIGVHREVAGTAAAAYFPVGDWEALAAVMAEVTQDADRRRQVIKSGITRAREFSWRETLTKTRAAYISSLSSSPGS